MDWSRFRLGVWNPVGHYTESQNPAKIVAQKKQEIKRVGFTLWGFNHKTDEGLTTWVKQIQQEAPPEVFAICSQGQGKAPRSGKDADIERCFAYRPVSSVVWLDVPDQIEETVFLPHKLKEASALILEDIISLEPYDAPTFGVEYFVSGEGWRSGRESRGKNSVPTKWLSLIRRAEGTFPRKVGTVFKLRYPYFAQIRPRAP